jgi:hypothetical protein
VAAKVSEFEDEPEDVHSRVTPVGPLWRHDPEHERQGETPAPALSEAGELDFWDSPPRYSVTNLEPLDPAPVSRPVSSPWRTWGARVLFALIFCATVVLLALEIKALASQDGAPRIDERASADLGTQ